MAHVRHGRATRSVLERGLDQGALQVQGTRIREYRGFPTGGGVRGRHRALQCPLCGPPRNVPLRGPVLLVDSPAALSIVFALSTCMMLKLSCS